MNITQATTLAGLLSMATLSAFEGGYDYKDLLKNGGTFYSDSDNPYIQKARFYGRAQYQVATVLADGGATNVTELRRTRLGAEVQFLNYFKIKGNGDLENGSENNVQFGGFTAWDDAGISADLVGLAGLDYFDKLSLTVGKQKIKVGHDVHGSSTKIKTIERSRLTDGEIRPVNSTGVLLSGEKAGVGFSLGVFSNAVDSGFNFWGNGARGSFLYASTGFEAAGGEVLLDFVKTFGHETGAGDLATRNNYAYSIAYVTELSGAEIAFNIAGGETLTGDLFFGGSILASTEIYENLELVGRVSYYEGDRVADASSRYARDRDILTPALSRGDSAFNTYAGLNYYFAGHQSKVMVGAEYDHLSGLTGNDEAVTLSAAYRMYF